MSETRQRDKITAIARSLFERGLTFGSTGNISVRTSDGWLMTPTGSSLGSLLPDKISKLDSAGQWVDGDKPTKESFLHLAMYRQRQNAQAIVHLHSTYSVAVSCLDSIDCANALPPLTAYYQMRVGQLPMLPYFPPGAESLAKAVEDIAGKHHAILLANHGPIVAGSSLESATDAIEELEQTARLFLLLDGKATRPLSDAQVADIEKRFPRSC